MVSKKRLRRLKRQFRTIAQKLFLWGYRTMVQIAHELHMAHSVSRKRADFLKENFFELSFQDRGPDQAIFDSITDPAELYYLADIHNWDDGAELLEWIASSPLCDQGTAALIFWRAQPDFYTEYAQESEMSLPDGVLPLLQGIMQKWEQGFYVRQQIAYNHREDPDAEQAYGNNPRSKWQIPAYLIEPTKGKPFLLI
jgi:hypothetical protein